MVGLEEFSGREAGEGDLGHSGQACRPWGGVRIFGFSLKCNGKPLKAFKQE